MKKYNKLLFSLSLIIYVILLLWVVVFKWTNYFSVTVSINNFRYLDLSDRYNACYEWFFYFDIKDLILNMVIFLPMGIFYLLPLKRKYLVIFLGFFVTLILEISQFFTCIGMFNVYDILGNFSGVIIGFILYNLMKKIYIEKSINIVNLIVIIVFSPVVIYAIYMTIKNISVYI